MSVVQLTSPLTDEQSRMLRHTLGLDHSKKPYRNHYAAAEGTPHMQTAEELVRLGLFFRGDDNTYGRFYHATESGVRRAGEKREAVKR